jgi:polyferredoxin
MHQTRQAVRRAIVVLVFLALPVTLNYYSPYLMTTGTAQRVATFSLFLWLAVLATAPFAGRAFCGWACPFNGAQTLFEVVGIHRLVKVRWLPVLKYVFWAAWVGAVIATAIAVGGWHRVDLLYMTENVVSIDKAGNLITYYLLIGLSLAPALLGRRGFCRYLCPFGVWGIVGEKLGHLLRLPRLNLSAEPAACTSCKSCERACPMQLPVAEMVAENRMRTTECILCGSCTDGCKHAAIRWGFGRAK